MRNTRYKLAAFAAFAALQGTAQGAINLDVLQSEYTNTALEITDVTLSDTEISLTVTGTFDAGSIGNSFSIETLFFGFDSEGDGSWMTAISNWDAVYHSGDFVAHGGDFDPLRGSSSAGGYLSVWSTDEIVAGDEINYTFTWYGLFDFDGFDFNEIIAQVGFSSVDPSLIGGGNIIVGTSPIPEPSLSALVVGFGALGLALRRRRRS